MVTTNMVQSPDGREPESSFDREITARGFDYKTIKKQRQVGVLAADVAVTLIKRRVNAIEPVSRSVEINVTSATSPPQRFERMKFTFQSSGNGVTLMKQPA